MLNNLFHNINLYYEIDFEIIYQSLENEYILDLIRNYFFQNIYFQNLINIRFD
jgi:hypothetical protein